MRLDRVTCALAIKQITSESVLGGFLEATSDLMAVKPEEVTKKSKGKEVEGNKTMLQYSIAKQYFFLTFKRTKKKKMANLRGNGGIDDNTVFISISPHS